ncbi:MAG TPA: ABC transporter permease [Gaiellaceae bacterium]|jgi:peptide/nickel transport system permease protein|nr:ABC transporter permease [Gaiellaceae bacterium]
MRFAGRRQARSAERGARSSRALFWSRFKRDRLALTSAIFLVFVIVGCFAGLPVAEHFLGHGPNDIFPLAADINGYPAGPWSHVPNSHGVPVVTPETPRTLFILGADGQLGHDEFLRLLAGGQTSLEIGVGAALLAILIGVTVGLLAGYYGRVIDTVFSRTTEFVMGFPILLFVIALGRSIGDRFADVTLHGAFVHGVLALILAIGLFSWFYPARLVRAQVLALREQEFVEAARMVGASNFRILRKHLLPHVASSVIVYGTLVIAGSILLEAALAILNFGIDLPDASWGNMISLNYGTLLVPGGVAGATGSTGIRASWLVPLWPSIALLLTVLAFALLGEGVRAALDPREQRR